MIDVREPPTPEIADQQEKLEKLLATRGDKFTKPGYHRSGGVRNLYRTNYGLNKEGEAVAKVERTSIDSLRAQRHLERGCTTEREIGLVTSLDIAGITRMVDYFPAEEAAKFGISGAVIVEEFRPDAISLEEWVRDRGALKGKQLKQFIRSYAETMRAVNDKGVLHRDHKPSNILLEEDDKGNIRVKVTDWANAAYKEEIRPSIFPTGGGHDSMHPKIMPSFASDLELERKLRYDDECEIYGMAHNIALAARGEKVFDYDPDRGIAIEWDTGKSVLTNGKHDFKKHNKALKRATRKMPRSLRNLVRQAMALDPEHPYYSVERFTNNAIHAAKDPNPKDLAINAAKWTGRAAAIMIPLSAALWAVGTHEPKKLGMPNLTYETAPMAMDNGDEKNIKFVREDLKDLPEMGETTDKLPGTRFVLHNRHVAALYKAYCEANHHLGMGWHPKPNDIQFDTWTFTTIPDERQFSSIETSIPGAIRYGITQAEISPGIIDLEDACTIARVGLKKLNQARWYSGGGRNFADYISARDKEGNPIISPEDQEFLKTWLAYVRKELIVYGSATGISPINFDNFRPNQPTTNPSDYWPAPRNHYDFIGQPPKSQPPLDSIDFTKKEKDN